MQRRNSTFKIQHSKFKIPAPPTTWTVLSLLRWTAAYLHEKGITEPRLNAELLLSGTLGIKRLDLYLQYDRPLRPDELAAFKARLVRRARHEPLQYIAGEVEFRELRLLVDRRVLIPRPETEVLVGTILERTRGRIGLTGLDVGTGSGAIALSLVTEGPFARMVGTDISGDAVEVARENLASAAPGAPVEFRLGAEYDPVGAERFDVIVSNPPYIAEHEREALEPQVREWEPATALFSGGDGLDVIRTLVRGAADHLRPGGLLALEIGASQAEEVARMVGALSAFHSPEIIKDLAGRDRIVVAELR